MIQIKKIDDTYVKLTDEINTSQMQAKNRYDSLAEAKRETENMYEDKIKQMQEDFQITLEEKRNEYSQKMLEDSANFQDLTNKKDEEAQHFEERIGSLVQQHNTAMSKLEHDHRMQMDAQIAQTEQLEREINRMRKEHEEILKQIQDDAKDEIEQIQKRNKTDLNKIQDMSLKSKADLQLTRNRHTDLETEIQKLTRDILDKETQLKTQTETTTKLKAEIQQ